MTFITGPSLVIKTTPIIDSKAQEHVVEVEMCEVHGPAGRGGAPPARGVTPIQARVHLRLLLATLSLVVGLAVVLCFLSTEPDRPARFQGFCAIPIKEDDDDVRKGIPPDYNMIPLRWSQNDADDVQMFNFGGPAGELVKTLRERFDIGDQVEKISVMDNGKRVNFIHDFEQNTTDIEDADRCFTTELDREAVMTPTLLLLSIQDGAVFDISRIRSALEAELPALRADAMGSSLRKACMEKPIYRLIRQEDYIIRKRSADAPAHDFIQFSGRGVQEIEISNLAEILQHEQDAAIAQR